MLSPRYFAPLPPLTTESPLVSVIMFCRNRVGSIHRAIESLLDQTYPHWELVIQDGASTDGTREAIESYHDCRIKLISEPDSGPFEAMWRALRRSQGELIGSCLSDEALLPQALAEGVNYFLCHPAVAALGRDLYYTTLDGSRRRRVDGQEFNYHDYLSQESGMSFVTVLFRKTALAELGFATRAWRTDCADFEIIARLGQRFRFDYFPGPAALFAQGHPGQLSTTPEVGYFCTQGHLRFIDAFYRELPEHHLLREVALVKAYQTVKKLYQRKASPELEKKLDDFFAEFNYREPEQSFSLAKQAAAIGKLDLATGLINHLPHDSSHWIEGLSLVAEIYENFGLPEAASLLWQWLQEANTPFAAERMLINQLKSPGINPIQILATQKRWASRLPKTKETGTELAVSSPSSYPTVAFHATNWDTLEIRAQILPLLTQLNPEKFTLIGYFPSSTGSPAFPATVRWCEYDGSTPEQFQQQVQQDRVDILIELSGFQPGHQLTAMASRCASIQMTYLGHMATTGIRQIDYQIADRIICPPRLEKMQTEKILHLPDCYTCFDFSSLLKANPKPRRRLDDRITFGCLAESSLLNQPLLELWATILRATPNSRLLIANPSMGYSDCCTLLRSLLSRHDLTRERLFCVPRDKNEVPRSLFDQIDIYLDTFPHNDPMGLALSLTQGIPVISLHGSTLSGGLSSSLLDRAELLDCLAKTPEEYRSLAVSMAQNPKRLAEERARLPSVLFKRGLTDVRRFARAFAELLSAVYLDHHR